MKRWLIVVVLLLASLAPAQAQEPGSVWLPFILKGADEMACQPFQTLEITDGTTTVNLLSPKSGFCLLDWRPAVTEPKGGGVWRDSQLADGRWPVQFARANVQETYVLAVRDWTPDDLIRDTQDLRRLLEKARTYSTDKWQDEPVWIKRQGIIETAPTYSIVKDYRTPQDGNPHGSDAFWTALGVAAFDNFTLIVEREPWWRGDVPGTGTCAEASGQQIGWEYGPWEVNTALPVAFQNDAIELSSTWMLSSDSGAPVAVWRTNNGTVWAAAAGPPPTQPYEFYEHTDGFVYAVCGGAGVYRSGDNGNNWALRNAGPDILSVNSLTGSGNWLFLCDNGGVNPYGVYRSNDGGATWNICLAGRFTVLGNDSEGNIYGGSAAPIGTEAAIWRSTDQGATWTIVHHPGDLDTIYFIKELSDGYLYAGSSGGGNGYLLRSSNGTDWGIVAINPAGYTDPPTDIILASDGHYYITLLVVGTGYVCKGNVTDWKMVLNTGTPEYRTLIEYSVNSRIYAFGSANTWWNPLAVDVGRGATCTDEVFVANKQNIAQLTDVWVYDAAPVTWTAQFPAAAFPFDLLNAAPAVGDVVYFGIDTTALDSGPFNNLVLDITTPFMFTAAGYTYVWEYYSSAPGWAALNVHDESDGFMMEGVRSVHWVPPSNWITANLQTLFGGAAPNVTAYWVRLRVTAIAAYVAVPEQGNRDVYTANWPRADVDEAQVLGDIPALMQVNFHNRSDEDGYAVVDELDLLENRVVVGLRSLDRGETFTAYLNCSDEQNPVGVTAADGANTADVNDIDHPTGRSMQHTTTGTSTWADECIFTLGPTVARDFYGSFHAYLRATQTNGPTYIGDVLVRLQVRTGSGGVTFTTEHRPFRNINDWQLLDFGGLDLPASGLLSADDLPDEMEIAVQVWSSAWNITVNLYDLVLIPTDEWAGDFVDKALEDDSGVTNGYFLDVDSVTYPKRDIRAITRQVGSQRVRSAYQPNGPSPASLRENADQRLWFLTARGCVTGAHTGANNQTTLTDANASFLTSGVQEGQVIFNVTDGSVGTVGATVTATTISDCGLAGGADNDWDTNDQYLIVCPNWRSEPWNCHSVQLVNVARYLSMKGAR